MSRVAPKALAKPSAYRMDTNGGIGGIAGVLAGLFAAGDVGGFCVPPGLVVAGPEGGVAFPLGFDGLNDAVAVVIRAIVKVSMF